LIGPGDSLPVGEQIWNQTRIALPPRFVAHSFQNILTKESVVSQNPSGSAQILVADALRSCPVALLTGRAD